MQLKLETRDWSTVVIMPSTQLQWNLVDPWNVQCFSWYCEIHSPIIYHVLVLRILLIRVIDIRATACVIALYPVWVRVRVPSLVPDSYAGTFMTTTLPPFQRASSTTCPPWPACECYRLHMCEPRNCTADTHMSTHGWLCMTAYPRKRSAKSTANNLRHRHGFRRRTFRYRGPP